MAAVESTRISTRPRPVRVRRRLDPLDPTALPHLAAAVIVDALRLWAASYSSRRQASDDISKLTAIQRRREDARKFLFMTSGPWARSRAFWVQAAGLDPQAVADRLTRLAHTAQPVEGVSSRGAHLRTLLRLWTGTSLDVGPEDTGGDDDGHPTRSAGFDEDDDFDVDTI